MLHKDHIYVVQGYLDIEEILRPVSPPVVSMCKGILAAYSFLFFGTPRHYAMRKIQLLVPCLFSRTRTRSGKQHCLTRCISGCWREDHFTVTKAAGIEERKKRVAEMIAKELTKAKTGAWVK